MFLVQSDTKWKIGMKKRPYFDKTQFSGWIQTRRARKYFCLHNRRRRCCVLRSDAGGQLVYDDCSAFGRSNDPALDKALFFLNDKKGKNDGTSTSSNVVSGLLNVNQFWIEDAHEAKLTGMSSVDDCILKVRSIENTHLICSTADLLLDWSEFGWNCWLNSSFQTSQTGGQP